MWAYIPISFLTSVVIGVLWCGLCEVIFWIKNLLAKLANIPLSGKHYEVWDKVIRSSDIDLKNSAIFVYKDGKLVNAGLPYSLPENMRVSKDIALMYCDRVMEEANKSKGESKLGDNIATYNDLGSGIQIEIVAATELKQSIVEEQSK